MATATALAAFVGPRVGLDHVVHDAVQGQGPDIGYTPHTPARWMDD